ncbi:MAG: hypothetical protein ISS88_02710 [Candidatus Portnoybacteria bacterium]|nr:hypothetical protein [Candidatus Portnoybacteria bacterium]
MEEKTTDKYQEPVEGEKEPAVSEEKPQLENEISVPKEEVLESEEKVAEEKEEVVEEKKIETEPAKEEPKREEVKKEEVAPVTAPIPPSSRVRKQIKSLKSLDKQSQIKSLCYLAFKKGLDFAVEVAKGLNDAYILDEFHDALVGELRKKLVEEGKLKQM